MTSFLSTMNQNTKVVPWIMTGAEHFLSSVSAMSVYRHCLLCILVACSTHHSNLLGRFGALEP